MDYFGTERLNEKNTPTIDTKIGQLQGTDQSYGNKHQDILSRGHSAVSQTPICLRFRAKTVPSKERVTKSGIFLHPP